jgi:hypothetical protein
MKVHRGAKARYQLLKGGLAALAVLASPSALYAQSCAMCYQTAANSGTHFIQALKNGILILLFPSLFIGTAFVIIAYRKCNVDDEDESPISEQSRKDTKMGNRRAASESPEDGLDRSQIR